MKKANTPVTKKEEEAYYKEAKSWDEDRFIELKKSRRTAWIVAGAAGVLALTLGGALAALIPLHSIEPYLVRVDASTGIVDQVVKIKDAKSTYDETMSKYFLRKVVTLRETYTRAQLDNNYKEAVLFTAPKARIELKQDFSFENPNGPYKHYGELGTATIHIKNTSFVSKNVAQVRYVRFEQKAGAKIPTHWIATIEFRYVSQPAGEEARGVNPIGFQVTHYRNDPEYVVDDSTTEAQAKIAETVRSPEPQKPLFEPPQAIEVPAPLAAPKPIVRENP
ncbi:virB8 family protein [Sulfurirhabdus autotrophica]|uniref:Type IV secretion system protein VirB8 n=1 Tax=Sulfurirhabdus autotrophica TaxID=1706046 RepID=A0A4R3XYI3_9PROT|nr:VirB8/TrbF family protein [Sulfurirhabdus autotrophica]TCV82733.1 type IV secretion system protein VirB8 [Sulfurirhabdus autotrophica]